MIDNSCIETVTVTTKRVIDGHIKTPQWGGNVFVKSYGSGTVELNIKNQIFSKTDLAWLVNRLTEISEAL